MSGPGANSAGTPPDRAAHISAVGDAVTSSHGWGGITSFLAKMAPMLMGAVLGPVGLIAGSALSSGYALSEGDYLGAALGAAGPFSGASAIGGLLGVAGAANTVSRLAGYDPNDVFGSGGTDNFAGGFGGGNFTGGSRTTNRGPNREAGPAGRVGATPSLSRTSDAVAAPPATPGYTGGGNSPGGAYLSAPGTNSFGTVGADDTGGQLFGQSGRKFGSYRR